MPEVDTAATREALLALGTATLGESGAAPLAPRIAAIWQGARLAAPAFPVSCPAGDNLAVHVALAHAPAGCLGGRSDHELTKSHVQKT